MGSLTSGRILNRKAPSRYRDRREPAWKAIDANNRSADFARDGDFTVTGRRDDVAGRG